MFKNRFHLEANGANDRKYILIADPQSPKGEVYDALSSMQKYVLKLMEEDQLKQKPEERSEEKEEVEQPQEEHAS